MRDAESGTHRIILANRPRLLRDILQRALDGTPDIEVVGETTDMAELPRLVDRTQAEWVIMPLTADGHILDSTGPLLADHPGLRVMGVATDGSRAKVMWVAPQEQTVEDVSLDELLSVLRAPPGTTLAPG